MDTPAFVDCLSYILIVACSLNFRFPGIEQVMPYESLQLQMEKRRRLNAINELNQSKEMKHLHFLNLCDIEDMTNSIRAREAQDPLQCEETGDSM